MIDIFLPPGVQATLHERIGIVPKQITNDAAGKIKDLWIRRNKAPEHELAAIDALMLKVTLRSFTTTRRNTPRMLKEKHDLHGTGMRIHHVFVMPIKRHSDYWRSVTNVPCPSCRKGTIRWHEAGNVPGYRICDGCGRS